MKRKAEKGEEVRAIAILLLVAGLSACDGGVDENGCPKGQDGWMCRERLRPEGERRDSCINQKIDKMSDADHAERWDADLVRALYEVCAKLYPARPTQGGK